GHRVGIDDRVASVFSSVRRTARLEARPREILTIPAYGRDVPRRHVPVGFGQVGVLVLSTLPIRSARLYVVDRGLLERCWIGNRRNGDRQNVRLRIALPVVIEKEERAVLDNRPTDVPAELVEMVTGLAILN